MTIILKKNNQIKGSVRDYFAGLGHECEVRTMNRSMYRRRPRALWLCGGDSTEERSERICASTSALVSTAGGILYK